MIDPLKSLIILGAILLYWKFVYYPFHKKDYTPISFFILGGGLFFYGVYIFLIGNTTIQNIIVIYSTMCIFLLASFSLLFMAIRKHGLKTDIDITLTWAKKTFPFLPFWFWMIISFPAILFIQLATFDLMGEEHLILWGMIFLAWIFSNYRLARDFILK
jgi:hypothetical protein